MTYAFDVRVFHNLIFVGRRFVGLASARFPFGQANSGVGECVRVGGKEEEREDVDPVISRGFSCPRSFPPVPTDGFRRGREARKSGRPGTEPRNGGRKRRNKREVAREGVRDNRLNVSDVMKDQRNKKRDFCVR